MKRAQRVVGLRMVLGAAMTNANLKPRSGGEKAGKPTEIAFDLWPL